MIWLDDSNNRKMVLILLTKVIAFYVRLIIIDVKRPDLELVPK